MSRQPQAPLSDKSANPPRRRFGRPPIENLEKQRRAQITASAAAVFTKHGYHATKMSQIARHAGVGQGTIYRYVGSKRDLLDLVFDYTIEEILRPVEPALLTAEPITGAADVGDRVAAAVDALLETFDRRPELPSLVLVGLGAVDEELKQRILGLDMTVSRMVASLLEEAQDAGLLRPGLDPEVCGLLVTKMLLPAGIREVVGDRDSETRHRYRAAMLDFAGRALFIEDT